MIKELAILLGGLAVLLIGSCIIFSNPVVKDIFETRQAMQIQDAAAAREEKMTLAERLELHNIKPPSAEPDEDEPIDVPMVWDGEI